LASQLLGRLLGFIQPEIHTLLERAKQWQGAPWLRPLLPSLTPPGHALLLTFTGHAHPVGKVTALWDGRRALSNAGGVVKLRDGQTGREEKFQTEIKLWDLHTGQELPTPVAFSGALDCDVAPDGRIVVVRNIDFGSPQHGETLLWNLEEGSEPRLIPERPREYAAVIQTPHGPRGIWKEKRQEAKDHSLIILDLESGIEVGRLQGHTKAVQDVAVTPDGRWAISSAADRTVRVWDLERQVEIFSGTSEPTGGSNTVTPIAITPDGKRAAWIADYGTLFVVDIDRGREVRSLPGHSWRYHYSGKVRRLVITPDGRHAVSVPVMRNHQSRDEVVPLHVWDLDPLSEPRTLGSHIGGVTDLAVTPDSRRVISAARDHTLQVWRLDSQTMMQRAMPLLTDVTRAALSPTGHQVVAAFADGSLKVWDVAGSGEPRTLGRHAKHFRAVVVSPDSRWAVSLASDWSWLEGGYRYYETLKVWDLMEGIEVSTLQGQPKSAAPARTALAA
jgi:WD40 repeat protein